MDHDNPINIEYRNLTQDKVYEAEFQTLLGAELFISGIKERDRLEVENTSNY